MKIISVGLNGIIGEALLYGEVIQEALDFLSH
jgi:hypothetical protein